MKSSLSIYRALEAIVGRSLTWKLGRWLYCGARRELMNSPAFNGENELQSWVVQALRSMHSNRNFIFLDIGANRGNWTAALLSDLHGAGITNFRVIAFEPVPPLVAKLRERFSEQINSGIVVIDPRAMAAEEGDATLSITGNESGTNSLQPQESDVVSSQAQVKLVSVDRFLEEAQIGSIDFLKIDTEGNDFNVMAGASHTLAEGKTRILQFEYNWRWVGFGKFLHDVYRLIEKTEYVLGRLTPNDLEIYQRWHPELERFIETNFVLVHRDFLTALPHGFYEFDCSNVPVRRTKAPSEFPEPLE